MLAGSVAANMNLDPLAGAAIPDENVAVSRKLQFQVGIGDAVDTAAGAHVEDRKLIVESSHADEAPTRRRDDEWHLVAYPSTKAHHLLAVPPRRQLEPPLRRSARPFAHGRYIGG